MTIAATDISPKGLAWNAEAVATVEQACAGRDAILECKLDGIRLLAQVEADGVHLWTRNGNDKGEHLAHVAADLQRHLPPGSWLDGEAVSMGIDESGHFNIGWGTAQSVLGGNPKHSSAQRQVRYVVFDLIAHRGIDARSLPFCKRRELLDAIFEQHAFDPDAVGLIAQAEATEENHEAMLALGFEGSMVKWLAAPYASGKRGAGQFKLKGEATVDGIVMGWKPGKNSFTGYVGSVIFGQYDEAGKLIERGACSGMDWNMRVWMTENIDALIEQQAVIEVTHNGQMPSGGLRHPRFIRFRDDKPPEEVTLHDA